jgi:hypothetical protein
MEESDRFLKKFSNITKSPNLKYSCFGFEIELVLADSLYGESGLFIQTLNKFKLPWILAIKIYFIING